MKRFTLILFILIAGLTAACSSPDPVEDVGSQEEGVVVVVGDEGRLEAVETEAVEPVQEAATIVDIDSLLAALESEGIEVTSGEPIPQSFFSVDVQMYDLGGESMQVFEYTDEAAMQADADQVAEDGSSVGTSMPFWVAAPHFFKSGRVLVLYVGEDELVLAALEAVLGEQFAGW